MELICPACNGFTETVRFCTECGQLMRDQGPVSLFRGPYSPYLDVDTIVAGPGGDDSHLWGYCEHLTICPVCGKQERERVGLVVP